MYKHPRPKDSKEIVYGIRPVMEAIHEDKSIDKILLQRGLQSELFKELFHLIRERNIPFQYVPIERLRRYTGGNHQGVVCFMSSVVYQSVFDIVPSLYEEGKTPFLLFLDRITDVRNFGAIARSAVCAGVDAIVIPAKHSAQINEDAVKSSAGALHKIPVCRHDNIKDALTYIKESGISLVGCTEKASEAFYKQDYKNPLCIVMGNEGDGISPDVLSLCDQLVYIPMLGNIQSLNVSVASGIVLFEVLRQREEN